MKKCKKVLCAALFATFTVSSVAAAACAHPTPPTDDPLNATVIADYTKTASERNETFASGSKGYSWENGEPFNCWWKPENVTYDNAKMSLAISEMTEKEQKWDEATEEFVDVDSEYYGAEARTEHYYGYGDFQVRMKPAAIKGTASTFFTCTGPYDKWYEEDGETVKKTNKHDEIDIEFLGQDTTKVQFNYFANGTGGHEYLYDLGFDASEEFHNYGFRWTESYITWFVDATPVYRVNRPAEGEWPTDAGRVIMNYWCGTESAENWMGVFENDYSGRAEYEWVKTSAEKKPDPNTAHIKPLKPVPVPEEGWEDISAAAFNGWGNYTVSSEGNSVTVSHSEAMGEYACCGTPLAKSYSWIKFTVKNNDTENRAVARIDVKKEKGSNAVENVISENEHVALDAALAAVTLELEPEETAEVAVKIKNTYIDQIALFLNSAHFGTGMPAQGSITISGLKGIVNTEVSKPDPADGPTLTVNGEKLALAGDIAEDKYTVANDSNGLTVSYTDIAGNCYANINASVAEIAKTHGKLTATLKNNGAEDAKVRIDVDSQTTVEQTTVCNVSAKMDGATASTDTTYGGSVFTVPAGKTVEIEIVYDASRKPTNLAFYFDSSTYQDENKYTGSVTISNVEFSGEVYEKPEEKHPVKPTGASSALTFGSTDVYTVAAGTGGAQTVTYVSVKGNSYANIQANDADTLALLKANDTVALTITNNGANPVLVRVDLIGTETVGNTNVCNLAHIVEGGTDAGNTDLAYGGTTVTVGAGEAVTVVVLYENGGERGDLTALQLYFDSSKYDDETMHEDGNLTLSDLKFGRTYMTEQPGPGPEEPGPEEPVLEPFEVPEEHWENVNLNLDGWENYTIDAMAYGYYNGKRVTGKDVRAENLCGTNSGFKAYEYLAFTVKNEEGAPLSLRIDIKKQGVEKGAVIAVMVDGKPVAINEEYGAALVTVGAYKTADVVIKNDKGVEVNQLVLFINYEDTTTSKAKFVIFDVKGIACDPEEYPAEPEIPADGWTAIDTADFGDWGNYTVDKTDGLNISHEEAKADYSCCGMVLPVNYSWVKFTVKNNSTENVAKLRIDFVKATGGDTPSFVEACYPVKKVNCIKNMVSGKESYSAGIILQPEEEINVVLKLKAVYFDQITVFFNSLADGDNPAAGNVTISKLLGIVDEGIKHEDPNASKVLEFTSTDNTYRMEKQDEGRTTKFTYNGVDGKSFNNIQSNIESIAKEGNNVLQMTIQNNGSSDCYIRLALTPDGINSDQKLDNVGDQTQSIEAVEGETSFENCVDGKNGKYFTIKAGQSVTIKAVYNKDAVKKLVMYIDSSYKDGGKNCSGEIVISGIYFSHQ